MVGSLDGGEWGWVRVCVCGAGWVLVRSVDRVCLGGGGGGWGQWWVLTELVCVHWDWVCNELDDCILTSWWEMVASLDGWLSQMCVVLAGCWLGQWIGCVCVDEIDDDLVCVYWVVKAWVAGCVCVWWWGWGWGWGGGSVCTVGGYWGLCCCWLSWMMSWLSGGWSLRWWMGGSEGVGVGGRVLNEWTVCGWVTEVVYVWVGGWVGGEWGGDRVCCRMGGQKNDWVSGVKKRVSGGMTGWGSDWVCC